VIVYEVYHVFLLKWCNDEFSIWICCWNDVHSWSLHLNFKIFFFCFMFFKSISIFYFKRDFIYLFIYLFMENTFPTLIQFFFFNVVKTLQILSLEFLFYKSFVCQLFQNFMTFLYFKILIFWIFPIKVWFSNQVVSFSNQVFDSTNDRFR